MVKRKSGLIVEVVEQPGIGYHGQFFFDQMETGHPYIGTLKGVVASEGGVPLVESGKVTIVGSVRSAEIKQRVEKTIRSVKGVAGVDNQLVITEATP
jgi:hypothetical protein